MKLRYCVFPFFFTAFMLTAVYAFSGTCTGIRCGSYLVDLGAPRHEVLMKCGNPDEVRVRVVEKIDPRQWRYFRDWRPEHHDARGYAVTGGMLVPAKAFVERETMTYDWGRNRFVTIFTFEDGRLVRIETGNYGGAHSH